MNDNKTYTDPSYMSIEDVINYFKHNLEIFGTKGKHSKALKNAMRYLKRDVYVDITRLEAENERLSNENEKLRKSFKDLKDELRCADPDIYIDEDNFHDEALARSKVERIIDSIISRSTHSCDVCKHEDEVDGSNCYECTKEMKNNFEEKNDENLLQEYYEVPVSDKVILDNIHEILNMGFDVTIKRNPTPDHLIINPYIDNNSLYEGLVADIMRRVGKEGINNFIIMISPDEQKYCTQPLDKFARELLTITMIGKDLIDRIEDIKDRFDPS